MPLIDHFHPPFSSEWQWASFHAVWITQIVSHLNQELLPPEWRAEANIKTGHVAELDISTWRVRDRDDPPLQNGGVATATWAPPALSAAVDFPMLDEFEVRVIDEVEGHRLAAVIELVSPANKDRPSHRRAFAIKCAGFLQKGVSVMIIDAVTKRRQDLHQELLKLLGLKKAWADRVHRLYTSAYRILAAEKRFTLEAWLEPLRIASRLPSVPLWVAEDVVVPLDLEKSYLAACQTLRIRPEEFVQMAPASA